MKNLFPKAGFVLVSLSLLLLSQQVTTAAIVYWDITGGVAGAGGATPGGNWGTTWNASADGSGPLVAWASGDAAVFSAGTDATGSFTVTLSANQTASSITVDEGTVSLAAFAVIIGAGSVTINAGATLSTDSSLRISSTAGSVWTINGGTARTTNPSAAGSFIDVDSVISLGAAGGTLSHITPNILNIVQATTTISGPGALTKTGAGVLAIASACTYAGGTTINDGELRIRTTANRLPIGTAVTVTSPGILNLNTVNQQVGSLSGNGLVGLCNATLTVGDASSTSFSGDIRDIANAGAGALTSTGGKVTKVGAGTLTLSGNNTYTGLLTLSAGGITVNSGASLNAVNAPVTVNAGTLTMNNAAQTIGTLTGSGGTISLGSGHVLTTDPAASSTYSGTISGSGGLTKANVVSGATMRTLTLSGPNTYDGNTLVNGGNVSVGSATALGSAVGYTEVASGAEVLFTGAGVNFTCNEPFRIAGGGNTDAGAIAVIASANPTLSGPITLIGDATITVSSSASATFNNANAITSLANQNLTLQGGANAAGVKAISGIIDLGTGGLTKLQGGTWVLSGANVYSGGTLVSAGTLLVNNTTGSGTGSGAVSVSSGATLGGNGTISGAVSVPSGATLAPGTSIGTLTLGVAPSLGGTVAMEANKAAGPVLTSDKLVVSPGGGTLAYSGTLNVTITGLTLAAGDTFDLFDADTFSGSFSSITVPPLSVGLIWDFSQLTVNGTISVVCSGTLTASAGLDDTICSDSSVVIGGSPTASGGSGSGYTYLWTPSTGLSSATVANPTASPASTTVYSLTVTDARGCESIDTVTVTVNPAATVSAGTNQVIQLGETATLAGSFGGGASSATWSGGTGSFSPDDTTPTAIYTPSATETNAGTVTLTLTTDDPAGLCPAVSNSVTIKINRTPLADTNTFTTATNVPLTISIGKLLGGASDSDGDTLSIALVENSVLPTGATISSNGNTLTYTPIASLDPGSFQYVLSDGFGGSNIVTVNITVTDPTAGGTGANSVFTGIDAGEFIARFAGVPGRIYTVETNGIVSGAGWVKFGNYEAPTNNAAGFGIGVFEVREAVTTGDRFFRTVSPSY